MSLFQETDAEFLDQSNFIFFLPSSDSLGNHYFSAV